MSLGKTMALAGLTIASGLSLSACATEDYVNQHIATVNQRIDGIEARLATVEGTANQANQTAQSAAASAQNANQRLNQPTGRVDSLEQMVTKHTARH